MSRDVPVAKTTTHQALLEAGANVDIKSGRRYHLMDEAVLTGDQAIVRQVRAQAAGDVCFLFRYFVPLLSFCSWRVTSASYAHLYDTL